MFTLQMEDTLWSSLTDAYAKLPMALTAEKLAEQYQITREQCDEFAYTSQARWANGEVLDTYVLVLGCHTIASIEKCFREVVVAVYGTYRLSMLHILSESV